MKTIAGKILYGLLFVVILPVLLILWARGTTTMITLPVPEGAVTAIVLIITGTLLMAAGMLSLLIKGGGLPMNAYPPARLVTTGIYSVIAHPIYAGAVLLSTGVSLFAHSSPGVWLITPLFALMTAAYVTGFENEMTTARFGTTHSQTFFSLPRISEEAPLLSEKVASLFLAFIPWLLNFFAFSYAVSASDYANTAITTDYQSNHREYQEFLSLALYPATIITPLIINRKSNLRFFITTAWLVTIISALFFFAVPFTVTVREFMPRSIPFTMPLMERTISGLILALPSPYVTWAFVSAFFISVSLPRSWWICYPFALLVTAACLITGRCNTGDALAGFALFLVAVRRDDIWNLIRRLSEMTANSWREWHIGKIRIINHGIWGGISGFTGMAVAGYFAGSSNIFAIFIIIFFIVAGASLWAQIIEGSPRLLRPYGYYGGIIGGIAGCAIVSLVYSQPFWLYIGAFTMAAPWIQIFGRFRCLVQGCCHGKPADENLGIRFTHPLSRVTRISGLQGLPLHPTQLYSIGCNLVTGIILFRLYTLQMPASFLAGIYLILNGTGRFVEEAYRGEAQTPYWLGIRIYQWFAICSIFSGAILTTINSSVILSFEYNNTATILALPVFLIIMFVSGVDFPYSNRRFARLTSKRI